jgi:predicted nicotinamide N-methyase
MTSGLQIKTISETWNIGSYAFEIERVRNLDDLVDQVSDERFEEDERLPYWAELWPSAIALSRHMISHPDHVREKSVLELGCGIGLTSLCLSKAGPSELVLSDYEQEALDATRRNLLKNKIKPPELLLLDWRKPHPERRFDRIVASDILYEKRFFKPLLNLFEQMLEPDGYIIIAEPDRPIAQNFFEMARSRHYFFSFEEEEMIQEGRKIRVRLCFIKK